MSNTLLRGTGISPVSVPIPSICKAFLVFLCRDAAEHGRPDSAWLLQHPRLQRPASWRDHIGPRRHHLPPVAAPHQQPLPAQPRLHLESAGGGVHRLRSDLLSAGPDLCCSWRHQVGFLHLVRVWGIFLPLGFTGCCVGFLPFWNPFRCSWRKQVGLCILAKSFIIICQFASLLRASLLFARLPRTALHQC